MRVLFASTMYPRFKNDTRGLMVVELCKNLKKEGLDVAVLAPGDKDALPQEILEGVHVYRFQYFIPQSLQRLAYGAGIPTNLRKSWLAKIQVPFFAGTFLWKLLTRGKAYDLIHAQWIEPAFLALLAKKVIKKPVVVTVRRVDRRGLMKYVTSYVLKHSDHVIFNSTYTKEESLKIARPSSYSVINNTVDIQKFKPQRRNDLKQRLNIPRKNKVILFVGLLVEKKGLVYLLKALKKVIKKRKDVTLVLAGRGVEEKKLKKLAADLGITPQVYFVGEVQANKTPQYFDMADVFVLPSIRDSRGETETLGVVLLEALACGTPVIASRVGGIPDVIRPNTNVGKMVPERDHDALAHAIEEMLKRKKTVGIRRKLHSYIQSTFSWNQKRKENLLAIYRKVYQGHESKRKQ